MKLQLEFQKDDLEIQSALDFAQNRLYVARSLIPNEYESYFQESAHYLSAHTSTAIEGNPLGEEEAMQVLAEGADPDNPMQLEKVNLDEAYELMLQLASDKATRIDEGIIRTVNSIVLKGLPESQARNRGRYRLGASLVVDEATRVVRYRPPQPVWVPELMKRLVEDIDTWRQTLQGPLAAALAHFGIVSIHPFEDGNGRTARLVADMLLHVTDWSADGMISLSQVIHQEIGDYYRVLREDQSEDFKEKVDVTEFVKFHTNAIGTAAARLEEKAVRFRKIKDSLAKQMKGLLNERQVTGLMFMIDIGKISSSRFARLTDSSQATAIADLNSLIERGFAVREGAGKNTRYNLSSELKEAVRKSEA
jgi:Fic family protein